MDNPLLEDWTGPFGTPPLDHVRPEHFPPAYDKALAEHEAEIAAITSRPAGFENTIIALEKSGKRLARVEAIFSTLTSSNTNDALQAIEREMAPRLSAHWNKIHLNAKLFARIDELHAGREALGLDAESLRVLERYHLDFVRQGAQLKGKARKRLDAIGQRLASLGTGFSQNVLADEQDFILPLAESQMGGLPQFARDAAAATAKERGLEAPFAVTLSRSSVEPFLQFAADRGLREQLFKAWTARGGNANTHNNKAIIAETLALRAEKARLLGYKSYADYKLADTMAGTPARARELLDQVWAPAKRRALEEQGALAALIAEEGGNFKLAVWDWRYYAEKLREKRYAFDEAALKPYFQLEQMIQAAFFTAEKLFDLSFSERRDITVYHPDVLVWEVARGSQTIGLFYGDYFARAEKQGGAWMSSLRDQETLDGQVLPLIVNNCNFVKSNPALLSFDDARTLFHEFGHALHGLLSRVRFPRLSGTNVARDFVELPSQLYEHWLEEPKVLERFARHYQTGEALPKPLLEKLLAARNFNQGFATVEFLASAFVDMDLHSLEDGHVQETPQGIDPDALQAATLARIGMPEEIAMRHAAPHFGHIFSGDGYSAGYYSYLWSEVLDADGFGAFRADPFDPLAARSLYDNIYSVGGTRDFAQAYRDFRGRDPEVKALLEGRGLETA
ncbi:MAG TPA: M3 family metallopeptidase [Rhizomicrobium sp.]|nr:M3 family metallopeptidase [Rhizomicrobium sp.]